MTLKRLVDEFCRRCGQQAATLTPDGRIRNWHKCPHDPPGVPNPPKPPMSPDVAVLVPPTCHTCGQPATCFGTYEGITGFGCDDCCGHGCEDGHCEPRVDDESPRVPLMSPVPHIGDLPGIGRALLYRVAIDLLTTDERSRLVAHLAERFGESIQDVADHLDTEGLPIRASTCSVVIQNVQRWV